MKEDIIPYIGPRSYEIKDKELFFGRLFETRELCSRIIAHSVVLCYSQSGAGKTSLINAGVIPRLEKEGFDILPVARVSGQIPKEIDPNVIKNIYIFNSLLNWSDKQTQAEELFSISMNEFLKSRRKLNDAKVPRLIIFDQFEELITHYQERRMERTNFFEQVVESLDQNRRLRVVFVMREDYIAYLDPYIWLFPNKLNIRFRLERMKRDAATSAIIGPITKTNINYAEGVPEYLVNELSKVRVSKATGEAITIPGEYIEPVQLQVVCQNLWYHLPKGINTITKEYIQSIGSVNDALRGFYDQAVAFSVNSKGVKEKKLRIWFEEQLITSTDTRSTIFRGPKESGGIPNNIIDQLQGRYIIRAEWRSGGRWYELTHDSLIKAIQDSNSIFFENQKKMKTKWMSVGLSIAIAIIITLLLVIIFKSSDNQKKNITYPMLQEPDMDRFDQSVHSSSLRDSILAGKLTVGMPRFVVSQLFKNWTEGISELEIPVAYFGSKQRLEVEGWSRQFVNPNVEIFLDEYETAKGKLFVWYQRPDFSTMDVSARDTLCIYYKGTVYCSVINYLNQSSVLTVKDSLSQLPVYARLYAEIHYNDHPWREVSYWYNIEILSNAKTFKLGETNYELYPVEFLEFNNELISSFKWREVNKNEN